MSTSLDALEKEIRGHFVKPISRTSAVKDLHRLATRISVIDASGLNVAVEQDLRRSSGEIRHMKTMKDMLKDVGKPVPVNLMRNVAHLELGDEAESLRTSQMTNFDVADFPTVVVNLPASPREAAVDSKNFESLKAVRTVVCAVAKHLETPEKCELIRSTLDTFVENRDVSELELVMRELFEKIGEDCKTARVFKVIHQGIIFPVKHLLISTFTELGMTKDAPATDPDSWKIRVTLAKDTVAVVHHRREMSMPVSGPGKQFYYDWELQMMFDVEMRDLESVSLRIINLNVSDEIDPNFKSMLQRLLCHGHLII
eukprot:TRINITY_DN14929_c0_g1_i1.p1 TRINITY_DN14929_c0_g1~~TRINITY_DN14929_c0_g1_i1.p1  ORF type:complete len:313 (+),score=58.56 TRINITY_DN14929_c0_g1_i1:110-1048(+)